MHDLSKIREYLQQKAAGDVSWNVSLKSGCVVFQFKVPGMLKSFFENVVRSECESTAPKWVFTATEKKGDLSILVKLTAAQSKELMLQTSGAVVEGAIGEATIALLRSLPTDKAAKLYAKWGGDAALYK